MEAQLALRPNRLLNTTLAPIYDTIVAYISCVFTRYKMVILAVSSYKCIIIRQQLGPAGRLCGVTRKALSRRTDADGRIL